MIYQHQLPLGAISLAIDINWRLSTILAKLRGVILNLFSKTGNHMNTIHDLSTLLILGAISSAININPIHPKLKETILNLFVTGNEYSLEVNCTEFFYQLRCIS